ncbi:hypothetical protein VOLCADRAFT_85015 [Volvox carteri f. nagariensis]|uniref:Uncharacterized protein n=1 Tax=Volvox carteri f. nagariensis TaxID=3068 RepID=D8UMB3_VOLCA|nr:uncharacterized protein VOLCADRAFT_85015 [Volvox carteri f. nagariensis]EFJ39136.1 hypothetical protein VOLCADRAFT_85015 [Volvox carteri f. nagariensis]|eukprot:XP_002959799.1 hypothetical protein VOLCADRAFT_85015 [Volvox carteri f. nagariensis]
MTYVHIYMHTHMLYCTLFAVPHLFACLPAVCMCLCICNVMLQSGRLLGRFITLSVLRFIIL